MTAKNDHVRLEKVDYGNYCDLLRLCVNENQKKFVASNMFSLAEAYAVGASGGYAMPFGIYLGDQPIGFLMIGYYPDEAYAKKAFDEDEEIPDFIVNSYLLWRFMIDKKYQGKGYGRAALKLALDYIRTFPCGGAEYCWLSYEPENEVARNLYRSFGFSEMPAMPRGWDEIPAFMKL